MEKERWLRMKYEDVYYYIDENGKKQLNDIQDYDDIMVDEK